MSDATHKSLAEALVAFQAEAPTFRKTAEAKVALKNGGEYRYTYTPLGDILAVVTPLLTKHGLAWSAKPSIEGGEHALQYALVHVSGEQDVGVVRLGVPATCRPQEFGSALSYMRRYAIQAQLNLATDDDDDGKAASTAKPQRKTRLPKATVDRLHEAYQESGRGHEWLRAQLVAAGLRNVPDGTPTRGTIQSLTPDQASKVIDACERAAPGV